MIRVKFDELQYGKEYKMLNETLEYPKIYYLARLVFKDEKYATLEVRLSQRVPKSFGDAIPYNIGVNKRNMDCEQTSVLIFENY